jgi:cyclophilin family peptidyl-prolyl cis-trans isomerase
VGTQKRERQKANRALKHEQIAKAETRRRGLRIGLIVVGAIAGIVGLAWVASNVIGEDSDSAPAATVPTDSAPTASIPTDTLPTDDGCPPPGGAAEPTLSFSEPPPFCLEPGVQYEAIVETNLGDFTIALDQESAPETVNNFVFLARNLYYDQSDCHRIIPDFVVQCGDPVGDPPGTGGPGYEFADELPAAGEYQVGSVAMANSGPDTNGSQWFVVTGDEGAALPPSYSLFGEVTSGLDTTIPELAALGSADGTPTSPVEILSVSIVES